MKLCVGIATYNRPMPLLQTLREIGEQNRVPDEIIVYDQSEEDEFPWGELDQIICADRIMWLRGSRPSLTVARNQIIAASNADVVVFIDDDVLLPTHFLAECATVFAGQDVACLQYQIYEGDVDKDTIESSSDRSELDNSAYFPGAQKTDAHRILFGCHAVKREAAIRVGGFEEGFNGPAFGEDVEFGFRLLKAGYRIHFAPRVWLIHVRAPRGGCRIIEWPQWLEAANLWISIARYGRREGRMMILLWASLRRGPLLRRRVIRFWEQPWAWASYVYGAVVGLRRGMRPVQSPFTGQQ